jgi:putative radical SAM enzyme (TIGR03279 family)
MAKITYIQPGSLAELAGVTAGWELASINRKTSFDILDYLFESAEETLELEVVDDAGERRVLILENEHMLPVGLGFASPTIDAPRTCANKCPFCFIDQNPPGLRGTLCVKDDDYRLSFLDGNYITLTNVSEAALDRIIEMSLSPINVSVHATDPALRRWLLGNPSAGGVMGQLGRLAAGGVRLNIQLVLLPGVNDGAALEQTLFDLAAIADSIDSLACVPVGLTAHREGLAEIEPFTAGGAGAVIDAIAAWRERYEAIGSEAVLCASDEFFILAGRALPDAGYYGAYPQYENGVGMARSFLDDLGDALASAGRLDGVSALLVTGRLFYPALAAAAAEINEKKGSALEVAGFESRFLGGGVTVAGLLAGADFAGQLPGYGQELVLIPAATLNEDGLFLDDKNLEWLGQKTGKRVIAVGSPKEMLTVLRRIGVKKK